VYQTKQCFVINTYIRTPIPPPLIWSLSISIHKMLTKIYKQITPRTQNKHSRAAYNLSPLSPKLIHSLSHQAFQNKLLSFSLTLSSLKQLTRSLSISFCLYSSFLPNLLLIFVTILDFHSIFSLSIPKITPLFSLVYSNT
jgi:hypothetical protein